MVRDDFADIAPRDGSAQIGVYCVDCGVYGHVEFWGGIAYSIPRVSVYHLVVAMTGHVTAGVELGIDANATYTADANKELFNIPLDGFEIPDVISAGPFLSLSADAHFEIDAEGQLLAGAQVVFGPFEAQYDFEDDSNTKQSGFTPQFHKKFKAHADIEVKASLSLPVELGFGVQVPLLDWSKTVGLVDSPGMDLDVKYEYSTNGTVEDNCNNGIDLGLTFQNQVYLELDGSDVYDIWSISDNVLDFCYQFGGGSPTNGTGGGSSGNGTSNPGGGSTPGNGGSTPGNGGSTPSNGTSTGNGHTLITQNSHSGANAIYASNDGNMYLYPGTSVATTFKTIDGAVYSDNRGRFLHYYTDEVGAFGVSRLRLSYLDKVPKKGKMIALVPQKSGYTGVDSDGNLLIPVICQIKHQSPKVFLVQSTASGLATLKSLNAIWTITGGVVTSCSALTLSPAS